MFSVVTAALKLFPHPRWRFLISQHWSIHPDTRAALRAKLSYKTKCYLARYLPFHWIICMAGGSQKHLKIKGFKIFVLFFFLYNNFLRFPSPSWDWLRVGLPLKYKHCPQFSLWSSALCFFICWESPLQKYLGGWNLVGTWRSSTIMVLNFLC